MLNGLCLDDSHVYTIAQWSGLQGKFPGSSPGGDSHFSSDFSRFVCIPSTSEYLMHNGVRFVSSRLHICTK